MNLSDLNFQEPVCENQEIVGGRLSLAATSNTLAMTSVSAKVSENGIYSGADALGLAFGDGSLLDARTRTFASDGKFVDKSFALAKVVAINGNELSTSSGLAFATFTSSGQRSGTFLFSFSRE